MIMKNSYLNLAFVFGSVAVDDDMHFKIVKLEELRLSLSRSLYLEKLLSTSYESNHWQEVKSSFSPNSASVPYKMSEALHRVEYPGFHSSTLL